MILVLCNAPCHHGFGPEIRDPDLNTKLRDTVLLPEVEDDRGIEVRIDFRIEGFYGWGSGFSQARSENGMNKKEVAQATQNLFARQYPSRVIERAQECMDEKGWPLIWIPRYMPNF